MRAGLLVVALTPALAPAASAAAKPVPIREAVSIGRIALGTTTARIAALGGRCSGIGGARQCALDGAHATFDPSGGAFVVWTGSARARTARGIGVGSTLSAMRARYRTGLVHHGDGWVLTAPRATTTFTVRLGRVSRVTIRRLLAPHLTYAGAPITDGAPGLVGATGAAPGDVLRVRLTLGTRVFELPSATITAGGGAQVAVSRAVVADVLASNGLVGDQPATILASLAFPTTVSRTFPVVIEGLPPDPLALSGPTLTGIIPDQDVALELTGIRPVGPPIEVRFNDCLDVLHAIPVPRTQATATISLPNHGDLRTAIAAACFVPIPDVALIDFSAGLVLPGGFVAASGIVELAFLP